MTCLTSPHAAVPDGTGWATYHDLHEVTGVHGLAVAWRGEAGAVRVALALDRLRGGWVTSLMSLRPGEAVADAAARAMWAIPTLTNESMAFGALLPDPGLRAQSSGLPSHAEHMAMARMAVAEAALPPAMRSALDAVLDHGTRGVRDFVGLRRSMGRPCWAGLAFAVANPYLSELLLAGLPPVLASETPYDALRQRWPGATAGHLRRLNALAGLGPDYRAEPPSLARVLLDLMLGLPAEWVPEGREFTHGLWDCAHAIEILLKSCMPGHWTPGHVAAALDLARPSRGRWYAHARRAAGSDDAEDYELLHSRAEACRDPMEQLALQVLVPLLASGAVATVADGAAARLEDVGGHVALFHPGDDPLLAQARPAAWELLYAGKGLPAALELSARWHARQGAMAVAIRGDATDRRWPALFEGTFRHGDLGVTAITDGGRLGEEGAAGTDRDGVQGMGHCVATRLPSCETGQAHVLSIRRHHPDGRTCRLSTCEVSVDAKGRVGVVQHRGPSNAPPTPMANVAVEALLAAVERGTVALCPEALVRRHADHAPTDGIRRHCGYDWRDGGRLEAAILAWEPLLPRWARGLGPQGLTRELARRGILCLRQEAGHGLRPTG